MPEIEGSWKAMWAVTSPSAGPEFGEVLFVEFDVSDFPFMDWMLADEAKADTISEAPSHQDQDWTKEDVTTEQTTKKKQRLSAAIALQRHTFLGAGKVDYDMQQGGGDYAFESLGQVSAVPQGTPWIFELALTNDGSEAWPEDL